MTSTKNENYALSPHLEHEVRPFTQIIDESETEPPAKSGADLNKSPKNKERLPAINGGDLRDAVVGQGLGLVCG